MLEQLRQYRFLLLLIAVAVSVIRAGGLHAHFEIAAPAQNIAQAEEQLGFSIFQIDDHHAPSHHAVGNDHIDVDVDNVGASARPHAALSADIASLVIASVIALLLPLASPHTPRPSFRGAPKWSPPAYLLPLSRGPPLRSDI